MDANEPKRLIPRRVQEVARHLNITPEAAYRAYSLTSAVDIECPCRSCEQLYNHRRHAVCPHCGAEGESF